MLAENELNGLKTHKVISKMLQMHFDKHSHYDFIAEINGLKVYKPKENVILMPIEPNTILTMIILGYLNYVSVRNPKVVYTISDLVKIVSVSGDTNPAITYSNFAQKYTVRNLTKLHLLTVKHIVTVPGTPHHFFYHQNLILFFQN